MMFCHYIRTLQYYLHSVGNLVSYMVKLNNLSVYSVSVKSTFSPHFVYPAHKCLFSELSIKTMRWVWHWKPQAVFCHFPLWQHTAVTQVQTQRDLKYVSGTSNLLYYWCSSWLVMDSKKGTFHQEIDFQLIHHLDSSVLYSHYGDGTSYLLL